MDRYRSAASLSFEREFAEYKGRRCGRGSQFLYRRHAFERPRGRHWRGRRSDHNAVDILRTVNAIVHAGATPVPGGHRSKRR